MGVPELHEKIKHYRYYYTTKEPTLGTSHVIHKKECNFLTDDILERAFVGFEASPQDALSRASREDSKKSYVLCNDCCTTISP